MNDPSGVHITAVDIAGLVLFVLLAVLATPGIRSLWNEGSRNESFSSGCSLIELLLLAAFAFGIVLGLVVAATGHPRSFIPPPLRDTRRANLQDA